MNTKQILSTDGRENILAIYYQATDYEKQQGREWYGVARTYALSFIYRYPGLSVQQTAGVIAALSPMVAWTQNCKAAEDIIRAYSLGLDPDTVVVAGFPSNKAKAWRILSGEDPDNVLKGNKVRSFYAAILGLSEGKTVTIDRHAFSIWAGVRITNTPTLTNRVYNYLSDQYLNVALQLGINPHHLQAITWVTYRRIHGIND